MHAVQGGRGGHGWSGVLGVGGWVGGGGDGGGGGHGAWGMGGLEGWEERGGGEPSRLSAGNCQTTAAAVKLETGVWLWAGSYIVQQALEPNGLVVRDLP